MKTLVTFLFTFFCANITAQTDAPSIFNGKWNLSRPYNFPNPCFSCQVEDSKGNTIISIYSDIDFHGSFPGCRTTENPTTTVFEASPDRACALQLIPCGEKQKGAVFIIVNKGIAELTIAPLVNPGNARIKPGDSAVIFATSIGWVITNSHEEEELMVLLDNLLKSESKKGVVK